VTQRSNNAKWAARPAMARITPHKSASCDFFYESLDGVGFGAEALHGFGGGLRVRQAHLFAEDSRIGQRECSNAARRTLYCMGDFLPGFRISGRENFSQAVDKTDRLGIEQMQDFGIEPGVAPGVARQMLHIDDSRHDSVPEMTRDNGRNVSRGC